LIGGRPANGGRGVGRLAASEAAREEVINIAGGSIVSRNVSSLIIMLREFLQQSKQARPTSFSYKACHEIRFFTKEVKKTHSDYHAFSETKPDLSRIFFTTQVRLKQFLMLVFLRGRLNKQILIIRTFTKSAVTCRLI
jgi:hypothetical protein